MQSLINRAKLLQLFCQHSNMQIIIHNHRDNINTGTKLLELKEFLYNCTSNMFHCETISEVRFPTLTAGIFHCRLGSSEENTIGKGQYGRKLPLFTISMFGHSCKMSVTSVAGRHNQISCKKAKCARRKRRQKIL